MPQAKTQALTPEDARARVRELDGWSLAETGDGIDKRYQFQDFSQAFAFMTRAALVAEKLDHHPDWRNVYNRVHVRLSTHDAGGLTDRDFAFAAALDRIIAEIRL